MTEQSAVGRVNPRSFTFSLYLYRQGAKLHTSPQLHPLPTFFLSRGPGWFLPIHPPLYGSPAPRSPLLTPSTDRHTRCPRQERLIAVPATPVYSSTTYSPAFCVVSPSLGLLVSVPSSPTPSILRLGWRLILSRLAIPPTAPRETRFENPRSNPSQPSNQTLRTRVVHW